MKIKPFVIRKCSRYRFELYDPHRQLITVEKIFDKAFDSMMEYLKKIDRAYVNRCHYHGDMQIKGKWWRCGCLWAYPTLYTQYKDKEEYQDAKKIEADFVFDTNVIMEIPEFDD